jgi:hypothetical protein
LSYSQSCLMANWLINLKKIIFYMADKLHRLS